MEAQQGGSRRGTGRLQAWMIVGAASLAIIALASFAHIAKCLERRSIEDCMSNVKQLVLATTLYIMDYDERYPIGERWEDAVFPYVRNRQVYVCPSADGHWPSYGLSSYLSGVSSRAITRCSLTVSIAESQTAFPVISVLSDIAYRHLGGSVLGFVDGHAKWCRPSLAAEYVRSRLVDEGDGP